MLIKLSRKIKISYSISNAHTTAPRCGFRCYGLLRWLDGMAGYRAGDASGKLQGSHSLSRITDRCNGCAR